MAAHRLPVFVIDAIQIHAIIYLHTLVLYTSLVSFSRTYLGRLFAAGHVHVSVPLREFPAMMGTIAAGQFHFSAVHIKR